jgi:hypothetical protein
VNLGPLEREKSASTRVGTLLQFPLGCQRAHSEGIIAFRPNRLVENRTHGQQGVMTECRHKLETEQSSKGKGNLHAWKVECTWLLLVRWTSDSRRLGMMGAGDGMCDEMKGAMSHENEQWAVRASNDVGDTWSHNGRRAKVGERGRRMVESSLNANAKAYNHGIVIINRMECNSYGQRTYRGMQRLQTLTLRFLWLYLSNKSFPTWLRFYFTPVLTTDLDSKNCEMSDWFKFVSGIQQRRYKRYANFEASIQKLSPGQRAV